MTKKNVFNLVFAISLLISTTSCGQKALPYVVDSTVSTTVDENIKSTLTTAQSGMKLIVTINDSTNAENYGLGKNFGAITQASLSHDTIFITSLLMARKATSGYKIILTHDSCTVKYFSLADEDIFKINKIDKPRHLILFVCRTNKLTFSEKPQFKTGELIEGMVNLTTDDFWSFNNGQNTKVRVKLTGYFKTNLSQFRPDEQGAFKQIQ